MRLDYIFVILLFVALFYLLGRSRANTHQTSVKQETINSFITFIIFFCLLLVLLGSFFLPVSIIQTLYFESCTIGYSKPPDLSIPLPANVLGVIIALAISWFLASKSEHMGMINEMGTKLVGNDKSSSGYIATKWLVLLFLPIIPIQSYEVFGEQQGASERVYYSMHPLPKLARDQVLATYRKFLVWYLIAVLLLVGFALLGTWKCF